MDGRCDNVMEVGRCSSGVEYWRGGVVGCSKEKGLWVK